MNIWWNIPLKFLYSGDKRCCFATGAVTPYQNWNTRGTWGSVTPAVCQEAALCPVSAAAAVKPSDVNNHFVDAQQFRELQAGERTAQHHVTNWNLRLHICSCLFVCKQACALLNLSHTESTSNCSNLFFTLQSSRTVNGLTPCTPSDAAICKTGGLPESCACNQPNISYI